MCVRVRGAHVLFHAVVVAVVGPADIGIRHADRDQVLWREGIGRVQLPPPPSLVRGDSGVDVLHRFDFDRVRVGGEVRPHGPRVPGRVERLPLVALGFDNEREPVSGRESLVVVCPRQGPNA